MTRRMGVRWHLREMMAARGMWKTSDLIGPLAEYGIQLSREQVYRLVVNTPQRLNTEVFAALCGILDCNANDLFEAIEEPKQVRKAVGSTKQTSETARQLKPVKARIRRPEDES